MKKIIILGYYGKNNLGDDILMESVTWLTNKIFNPNSLVLTSNKLTKIHHKNVTALFNNDNYINKILKTIRSSFDANVILFGGGSVFHSVSDSIKKLIILIINRRGKKIALGVSIGPFKDKYAIFFIRLILNRLDYISVRDELSLKLAKQLSPNINVELIPDLAMLLPQIPNFSKYFNHKKKSKVKKIKHIAISLRSDMISEEKINEIINFLKFISLKQKLVIHLFEFNHSKIPDSYNFKYISSKLKGFSEIKIHSYNTNSNFFLKELKSMDLVIGMRLHAQILSYLFNIPQIMISYHRKSEDWARLIRKEDCLITVNELSLDKLKKIYSSVFIEYKDRDSIIKSSEKYNSINL